MAASQKRLTSVQRRSTFGPSSSRTTIRKPVRTVRRLGAGWKPPIKRGIVLGTLIAVGALSLTVTAIQPPQQPQGPKVVQVEKLKDNLFVLR